MKNQGGMTDKLGLNFQKYKDCETNKQLQPQTHTDRQPVTFKQEFVPNIE